MQRLGTADVTLDATGAGQVQIGPPGSVSWDVRVTSVRTSTATLMPTAQVFLNGTGPGDYVESSYTGAGDSSNTQHQLEPGDFLIVTWTGGDPGARATASLRGYARRQ